MPTPESGPATLWKHYPDTSELIVWADRLLERGDPRGEYVRLRLADLEDGEHWQAASKLEKKLGGKLVGPARTHLREWVFDQHGLVQAVTCEAQKLPAGFAEIVELHPRLWLRVTSLRKKTAATIASLLRLPLERVHYLILEDNELDDAALTALAPALKRVRHLSLAGNRFTAAGLQALGAQVQALELLCVGVHLRDPGGRELANAQVDAIVAAPGFKTLRAIAIDSRHQPDASRLESLRKLPKMVTVQQSRPELSAEYDAIERLTHPPAG